MLKKFAEWFRQHEPLITALINFATAMVLLFKAAR